MKRRRMKRNLACLAITLEIPVQRAFAQGMPWDTPLTQLRDALTGTTAQLVLTIAIVVAGLGFAVGETGGFFRRMCGVVFGAAIAIRAADLVARLFA